MADRNTATVYSDAARAACSLLDPVTAQDYCRDSHRRADLLERSTPPAGRTLPALLRARADTAPDAPLLRMDGMDLSARQICDSAARLAGRLTAAGIAPGDRVALISANRLDFIPILAAIAWAGAVAVPINIASRGDQLRHILDNSAARLLIIEADLLDNLATVDRESLMLETVFVLDAGTADLPAGAVPMPDPGAPVEPHDVRPADPMAILYTSGTTGVSKGVICPHEQFFWWAITTGRQLGIRPGDVLHTTLPLFHTNAINCFFQALVFGGAQSLSVRFSVSRFYEALKKSQADVTYLLGAMVPMLLSRPESPEERDHTTRIALAPGVPAQFHDAFVRRTGILLLDAFGSTESNNVIQTEADSLSPGLIGRITKGFEARVVDEFDNCVPDGTSGELLLRADQPNAFAHGYFGMPDKTVETWKNLWLHTGDRVVRDADGYFRFVDRIKETIRRRGENISSYEVEQGVLSHPAIATAAVFPVDSELAEDEVMVAIVLKDGATLEPEDLIRHCEDRLPYYSVPRYIDIRSDLPRTENGKIQKFKLREEGVTPSTWDRESAGVTLRR
ncbi:ATP-dependent acyl-CoA ligase [Pseudooceanicola sp. C21-150M6]|uniref:ATP-dependent acyl-CoA ligase n=1 Tax=Pseudooceanicola sp. C21-150M6 TaxID=3434355 RepID=UPI003D7F7750